MQLYFYDLEISLIKGRDGKKSARFSYLKYVSYYLYSINIILHCNIKNIVVYNCPRRLNNSQVFLRVVLANFQIYLYIRVYTCK